MVGAVDISLFMLVIVYTAHFRLLLVHTSFTPLLFYGIQFFSWYRPKMLINRPWCLSIPLDAKRIQHSTPLGWQQKSKEKIGIQQFSSYRMCVPFDVLVYVDVDVDVAFYADDSLFRYTWKDWHCQLSMFQFSPSKPFWLNIQLCKFRCHAPYFINIDIHHIDERICADPHEFARTLHGVLFKFYYSLSRMFCCEYLHAKFS